MMSTLVRAGIIIATFSPVALLIVICDLWQSNWVKVGIISTAVAGILLTLHFFRSVVKQRNPDLTVIDASKPRLDSMIMGLSSIYAIPAAIVLLADSASRWAALVALLFIIAITTRSNAVLLANPMLTVIGLHPHDAHLHDGTAMVVLSPRRTLYTGDPTGLVMVDEGIYVDVGPSTAKSRN